EEEPAAEPAEPGALPPCARGEHVVQGEAGPAAEEEVAAADEGREAPGDPRELGLEAEIELAGAKTAGAAGGRELHEPRELDPRLPAAARRHRAGAAHEH